MKKLLTTLLALATITTAQSKECAIYTKDHQIKDTPDTLFHLPFDKYGAYTITEDEYNNICFGKEFCKVDYTYYGKYQMDLDTIHQQKEGEADFQVIPRYSRWSKKNSIDLIEGDTVKGFYINNRMKFCTDTTPYIIYVVYEAPENNIKVIEKHVDSDKENMTDI
ncbi:hypothetical protein H5203_18795 [Pseudoalteromonas sp. SG41-1]|uniref:hypothetical protein n=1 Tax=Pseudoalteromonas sp. SG41-1 TaxID=2760979 RepID=UPI0016020628|nr:hypothetical protein [Pseudoalteromonas sp. SG41-1]MBB1507517.1 hypothetical protein [Pseudoalteromonas sp. SG41-1]